MVSTFLDPGFGLNAFPPEEKEAVKRKIYNLLLAAESIHESSNNSPKQTNTKNKVNNLRPTNYLSFKVKPIEERTSSDKVTEIIDKYLHLIDTLDVAENNLDEIKRVDARLWYL